MGTGVDRRARSRGWRVVLATAAVAALLAAAGCSTGSTTPPSSGAIVVSSAWVRPTAGSEASAAYFSITNGSGADDVLLTVSTAIAKAEMHQTMAGASGMMGMEPVASIPVPKGSTVEFKPGGYHVMLTAPAGPIEAGKTVQLTLTFQRAGQITVSAEVRAP